MIGLKTVDDWALRVTVQLSHVWPIPLSGRVEESSDYVLCYSVHAVRVFFLATFS